MDETQILQLAQEAIRQGDKAAAQKHLLQVIQINARNEIAWLWLSAIVDDPAKEQKCLERVIAINPDNVVARRHLQRFAQSESVDLELAAPGQIQPVALPVQPVSLPSPSLLELYGAGFVLPCISPAFYFHTGRRRVAGAVGFFFLFALAITVVQILSAFRSFGTLRNEIEQAFSSGGFPEITISRGQATIHGMNPFVREFDDSILILDTTGEYTPSNLLSGRYNSGFLLTKTEVYSLDEGGLDSIKLSDLQAMVGDPFVLDAKLIQTLLGWFQIAIFIVLVIWNSVVRLIYLGFLALPVWGIAAAIRRGSGFAPVFITGIYALVPAVYGAHLLSRIGIRFCGLQTILWLIVWAVGLVVALSEREEGIMSGRRPLRSWRALIGVPMLLVLALDAVFLWSVGGVICFLVTLFTLVALAFIGLWPIMGVEKATGG
ncbi:MAG: DUF1189 family protein [Anaerolineae bacterium]|nr:DUF1189 family protein [Anaerolineae bacterium]